MNIIGEEIKVISATDPTKKGLEGRIVLETSKTVLLDSDRGRLRLEKKGLEMLVSSTRVTVRGDDLVGRLEGRIGRSRR